MKTILFSCILILSMLTSCIAPIAISSAVDAQKQKKTNLSIVMKNGEVVDGNFHLPKRMESKIKVTLPDGKAIKIPSDSIEYVHAWSERASGDIRVKLIYTDSKEYKKNDSRENTDTSLRGKRWIVCYAGNSELEFYAEATTYKVQGESTIVGVDVWGYLVKKSTEDLPLFYYGEYKRASYEAFLYRYFADCPSLINKMEEQKKAKNDTYKEIEFLLSEYEKCGVEMKLNK